MLWFTGLQRVGHDWATELNWAEPNHFVIYDAYMWSHFSRVQLRVTLWTVNCQAPLSLGFSRQEYCSWLPCPPPGDLLNPMIEPWTLMSPALAGEFFTTSTTWEFCNVWYTCIKSACYIHSSHNIICQLYLNKGRGKVRISGKKNNFPLICVFSATLKNKYISCLECLHTFWKNFLKFSLMTFRIETNSIRGISLQG